MAVLDVCLIVVIAAFTFYVSEMILRQLYDDEDYIALQAKVERMSSALEEQKGKPVPAAHVKRVKLELKQRAREVGLLKQQLTGMGMRWNVVTGLMFVAAFWGVSSWWGGVPVCRLPFEPFVLVRALTHRGIPGEDYREASATFIFVLCNIGLKPLISKLFGAKNAQTGGGFTDMLTDALKQQQTAYDDKQE